MTKSFTIKYAGADSPLELEDNPRAGVIIKILKNALKYKAGNPIPEPDLDEYLIGLATNLITKAPWTLNNPETIRGLPWQTYADLCNILGNEFPLENFLFPAARLMYGKKLDSSEASTTETSSTTGSQNSASPSEK